MSASTQDRKLAQDLLERAIGRGARFRAGQLEAILLLVADNARLLVVERTGWGKSVVYFLATRMLRDRGAGPTIIVSPLLSLMRDQLRMAQRLDIDAETIHNSNRDDWGRINERLAADEVDLLFITPERLSNQEFRDQTIPSIAKGIGMVVIDEAHCISDWGHDFRPDYRRIRTIVARLPETVPLLATTATANDRVVTDIEQQLGPNLHTIRGELSRDSLRLQNVVLRDQAERLAWLAEALERLPGSGIIYVLTTADARRVSRWLAQCGFEAPAYYAGLDEDEKIELEEWLRADDVKALVATIALGMGFDKPDLGFVVHFQRPSSAVTYYQQIGRAGRSVENADVVLLAGREDDDIAEYFIGSAFPPEDALDAVLAAVAAVDDTITAPRLEIELNLTHGAIEQCLKILQIDGAVGRDGGHYFRTANPWVADRDRVDAVTATRRHELDRMREYVHTDSCLMQFLAWELDDREAERCGRCANCAAPFLPLVPDAGLVQAAAIFLRRAYRPILPRKMWPLGIEGRRGRIPAAHRLLEGRALSVYGDAGWGRLVRAGKYRGESYDDELLDAVVNMINISWQPDPAPEWITCVPSLRDPVTVPQFAARLASALGIRYRDALRKVQETAPQKDMQNRAQQAANVAGAFVAIDEEVLDGPVLLFDDIVNSGWSFTVCGMLLREAGSGDVFPVALAATRDTQD